MPLPGGMKAVCETVLVRGHVPALFEGLRGRTPVILAYHNVVPDGMRVGGDRSLHLPLSDFLRQLDLVQERYDVVPLGSLLDPSSGDGAGRRLALTFDDAYRGAVTVAAAHLTERRVAATFFVTPAFVGGGPFWWDAVRNERASGLPDGFRRRALERLEGDDRRVRRWAVRRGYRIGTVPRVARCASADELRWAASRPGIDLAPHGWSHRNLTRLGDRELREELRKPLSWLRHRYRAVAPWLAYPYGLWDRRVEEAARAAGYRGALALGRGGGHRRGEGAAFTLPRVNVPAGVSLDGFLLRVAGVLAD